MKAFKKLIVSLVAVSAVSLSFNLAAEEDIDKLVEQRQELMGSFKDNTKAISKMLKGEEAYSADKIKAVAADLHKAANSDIIAMFPEDSTSPDSDALDEIWMDFTTFESRLADFRKAADALNTANHSDKAAVGMAMKDIGASCKGCHKSFKN